LSHAQGGQGCNLIGCGQIDVVYILCGRLASGEGLGGAAHLSIESWAVV